MTLLDKLPWEVVIPWIVAQVFPYISAWATKRPSWVTGLITAVLSALASFGSEYLANKDNFDWKVAIVNLFLTVGAAQIHREVASKGEVENNIHANHGNKPVSNTVAGGA